LITEGRAAVLYLRNRSGAEGDQRGDVPPKELLTKFHGKKPATEAHIAKT